jgi:hypothetical protein
MFEQKQCPLKVACSNSKKPEDTTCNPDCAWFMEKGKTPECAIKHIARWNLH